MQNLPTSQSMSQGPLAQFRDRLTDYLPTFAGGLVVLLLGVAVGWVAKRAVVRALIWLRLDRLGGRHAWRAAFSKGDVRSALYNVIGSIAMALIIMVFLINALQIWGLGALAQMIERILFYIPNLGVVAIIVGAGLLLANTLAAKIEDALEEEDVAKPRLLAKIFKGALLAVVGALAMWQLGFARQIVLAAFLIGFGAIGIAFAVGVGLGSAKAIQKLWEGMIDKTKES